MKRETEELGNRREKLDKQSGIREAEANRLKNLAESLELPKHALEEESKKDGIASQQRQREVEDKENKIHKIRGEHIEF